MAKPVKALLFFAALVAAGFFILLFIQLGKGNNATQIDVRGENSRNSPADEKEILPAPDPAALYWEEVTSSAQWSERDSHAVAVFRDKLWLMGGLNGNGFVIGKGSVEYWKTPHMSDVWVSENGKNWTLVSEKSPWGGRRSIQVAVFRDKMWLLGGWGPEVGYKNDVWISEDGINWERVTADGGWPAREGHELVVFQDKLWIIGGVRYDARKTKNDVWSSEDGIRWTEATSSAPWSPRWDHAVSVFKDKLWLTGGMDLEGNTFKDVWSSEDGKNWTLVTETPPWHERQGYISLVYQDKLWLIGGLGGDSSGGTNDVWYSDDGYGWKKTSVDPQWLGREDLGAAVFKDKIWVMGGMDKNWTWTNDIWHSEFPALAR